MIIITESVRPDIINAGDYIWSPMSKTWEPVKSAYWSDTSQCYVVYCGPLGLQMFLFGASVKVTRQRRYT